MEFLNCMCACTLILVICVKHRLPVYLHICHMANSEYPDQIAAVYGYSLVAVGGAWIGHP